MKWRRSRRFRNLQKEVVLDLTPLIDIIFLLLIFFMVSTTFIKTDNAINLKLPQTVSGKELLKNNFFVITVDKKDGLYVKDKKIDLKELEAQLFHLPPTKPVIIKADKVSHHGIIVKVMDILTKHGITNFSFATEKEDEK